MSSKPKTQESTQDPWEPSQPYLRDVMSHGQNMFRTAPVSPYPGQRVAGFNQADLRGQNYLQNYASGVQPYINQAQGTSSFLQDPGQMLTGNPYLRKNINYAMGDMTKRFNEDVMTRLQSDYRRAQPFAGSREELAAGKAAEGLADQMGQMQSQMYGDAYRTGMQGMLHAQEQAPGIARMGMFPAELMGGVGAQQRQRQQQRINAGMQRWQESQQAPWDNLGRYQAAIQGMGNMGGTTTTPAATSSPLMGAASGAAMGFGATGTPIGAAVGGGLGLLGSYLA